MNYNLLNTNQQVKQKNATLKALRTLLAMMKNERRTLIAAFFAIIVNATLNLAGPLIIGHTIDKYVQTKQFHGVLVFSGILLFIYLLAFVSSYLQSRLMGGFGQRMLFQLRNAVFNKLQELPVAFFNQNKAGDLISRVNNDTDKLNQFFSQSLMQFVGSLFIMTGAGIFLLSINLELGSAALCPALLLFVFTRFISPWVKSRNAVNMKSLGNMSSEIQESLNNFKVIIAFNRRDYFRKRFNEANQQQYATAVSAGLANNLFMPVFGLSSNLGQLVVLSLGIYMIASGDFTMGLLISFLAYVTNFYNPLRQLAALWTNFQVAMAGWDRISQILSLQTNIITIPNNTVKKSNVILEFKDVHFGYPDGKEVIHHVNFKLEKGKTYALVGPTGGGKTTTASLIARLYDATSGAVLLDGKDIRGYEAAERTQKIGFILQDPFLFTGTIKDNILYGNEKYAHYSNEALTEELRQAGLETLLNRFEKGLDTPLQTGSDSLSLGQKQLIAFIRAVLRSPEILILDEATANIDTITEQLLEDILQKLPSATTKVIIAHRLNTIANADEIYFVNSGEVLRAGSLEDAMDMLMHDKRES